MKKKLYNFESVRFEPVNPVCEATMLTTGLARQSQQMYNNMLHSFIFFLNKILQKNGFSFQSRPNVMSFTFDRAVAVKMSVKVQGRKWPSPIWGWGSS